MMSTPPSGRTARAPLALLIGFGVFVVVIAYLVTASLTRRAARTFSPTVRTEARGPGRPGRPDTVTVDARDADRWVYVDLDRGMPLGTVDSTGWDIAVRRYRIRARGPSAVVARAPFPDTDSAGLALASAHGLTQAPDLGHWYSYSMLSHLLEPDDRLALLRTDAGATAVLQVLGYYCPGLTAGCLTVRYAVVSPNVSP